MSFYNTVVLSFNFAEYDGEKPPANFAPLRKINSWLKKKKFGRLTDLSGDALGTNAVLYGVCGNYLDIDEFIELVSEQKWNYPDDVQILFWSDCDVKFSVAYFPKNKSARFAVYPFRSKRQPTPRRRRAKK